MPPNASEEPPEGRPELAGDILSAVMWGVIAMVVTYALLRPEDMRRVRARFGPRPMTEAQARVERAVQELRRDLNAIEHSWPQC